MIIEVNTGAGFRATISYVQKEHEPDLTKDKKPEILEQNNVYGNTRDMAKQMRFIANSNSRVSKPVMHLSVNFNKDEKLSEEQRQQAVKAVLKEIGVKQENHQYFIVKHNDTNSPHYHIVLNKLDLDGKKLNLGFKGEKEEFIKNKLQVVADKIEQEQGLKRTEGRNIIYDANNEKGYRFLTADEKAERKERTKNEIRSKNPNIKNLQEKIQGEINKVIQDKSITTAEQFKASVESKGINVLFLENKNGISGISFKSDKISVKGSQIGAKWNDIDKALITNAIYGKENEIKAYIAENTLKMASSTTVVDQAIREKMNEIKPNVNAWETWRKNPNNEQLYNHLQQYSEKMKEQNQEEKTSFQVAKEQRENKQEQNQSQSQGPKEGLSRFEQMKTQREEKSQDQDKKRGFRR